MLHIDRLLLLAVLFSYTNMSCQEETKPTVLVSYANHNPDEIRDYKYVVLESENYNAFEVKMLKDNNDLVLGYISLGEVSPSRFYYKDLSDKTKGKNEIWDSYYLDLRDKITQQVLLSLIDKIHKKGFDGLFLDTVDVYGPWGSNKDDIDALGEFLAMVKAKYPEIHLMQNSGVAITDVTSDYINSIALESVATNYNFEDKTYRLRAMREFSQIVSSLKEVSAKYDLPIILIEYADKKSMISRVQALLKPLEWNYFIGNIELDNIPVIK